MMRVRFPLTAPDLAFLPAMTGYPEWWESVFIKTSLRRGFLLSVICTSAIVALSDANTHFHLAAVPNQSYLYAIS
jgi:hypothetical protein